MTTWYEPHKSILHTKRDGSKLIIKLGDCITHSRHELPIRVDRFTFVNDKEVIGFEYLPWRGTRWGTPAFSMRGNPRHIICMPGGILHYGLHIEWDTVQVVPNPDPTQKVSPFDLEKLDTDELVKRLELLEREQVMREQLLKLVKVREQIINFDFKFGEEVENI
jgi:hypothetical protein